MEGFVSGNSRTDTPEDFPTPPWATRALMAHILPDDLSDLIAWEPTANRGHMVRPLAEKFGQVIGSDKYDYGAGFPLIDFLDGPTPMEYDVEVTDIVMNPPFSLFTEFVERALSLDVDRVCVFGRAMVMEGKGRYERIWSKRRPNYFCPFVERVRIVEGRVEDGSTRMPYAWFIWQKNKDGVFHPLYSWPRVKHIPPCKSEMERDEDYGASTNS